jgi:hypothetical protein
MPSRPKLELTEVRSLHSLVEQAKKVTPDALHKSESAEAVTSEANRAAERKQNVSDSSEVLQKFHLKRCRMFHQFDD